MRQFGEVDRRGLRRTGSGGVARRPDGMAARPARWCRWPPCRRTGARGLLVEDLGGEDRLHRTPPFGVCGVGTESGPAAPTAGVSPGRAARSARGAVAQGARPGAHRPAGQGAVAQGDEGGVLEVGVGALHHPVTTTLESS